MGEASTRWSDKSGADEYLHDLRGSTRVTRCKCKCGQIHMMDYDAVLRFSREDGRSEDHDRKERGGRRKGARER